MSLREQLRDILPQILPADPAEAIKGTELIRLVRFRLGDEYSDATLRYHFSILSYDPTSPIAKVDQGQGYYFRDGRPESEWVASQGRLGEQAPAEDAEQARYDRFRCIVERHSLYASRYPFVLREQGNGEWEVPDLVITDWDLDTDADDAPRLDKSLLQLKQSLGVPGVSLTAAQLSLQITLDSCNSDFFRTLSATRWANQSEILIAEKVSDEALVNSLRLLGHQFGVGILSFGIDLTLLDELPAASDIRSMTAAEFESLQTLLKPQRISVGTSRPHLDWQHLTTLKKKYPSVGSMLTWLSTCLENQRPSWPHGES